MSYNLLREVSPSFALCSFSSAIAGNVTFTFINGDYTPSILLDTITLEAGYEYFLVSSPCADGTDAAVSYRHIINGVDGDLYTMQATSLAGGLDQQFASIQNMSSTTFQIYADSPINSNSRLEVWRFPQ
jgi:hypothetical protein